MNNVKITRITDNYERFGNAWINFNFTFTAEVNCKIPSYYTK